MLLATLWFAILLTSLILIPRLDRTSALQFPLFCVAMFAPALAIGTLFGRMKLAFIATFVVYGLILLFVMIYLVLLWLEASR